MQVFFEFAINDNYFAPKSMQNNVLYTDSMLEINSKSEVAVISGVYFTVEFFRSIDF